MTFYLFCSLPVAPSSSAELETSPAFPVMLHPPLPPDPALSQHKTTPSASPVHMTSQTQHQVIESRSSQNGPDSVPGDTEDSHSTPPTETGPNSIHGTDPASGPNPIPVITSVITPQVSGLGPRVEQITSLAPILGPPAPPYSDSSESDLGAENSASKLIPVPFSSVYSL